MLVRLGSYYQPSKCRRMTEYEENVKNTQRNITCGSANLINSSLKELDKF